MKNTKFILFFFMSFFMVLAMGCKKEDNSLQIGDDHEGGLIFYLDETGEHGLVAAPSDQSSRAQWGCIGNDLSLENVPNFDGIYADDYIGPEGPGSEVGDGASNTAAILKDCPTAPAALACVNYTGGGYTDWFLPSIDELHLMYINRDEAGLVGFTDYFYWSSTEINWKRAWRTNNWVGGQSGTLKDYSFRVRAVRAF